MSRPELKSLTCPSETIRQAFQAYAFEHRFTQEQELFLLRFDSTQDQLCTYTVPATLLSDGRLTIEWDQAQFTPPLDANDSLYSDVDQKLLLVYQRLIQSPGNDNTLHQVLNGSREEGLIPDPQ